MTSVRRLRIVSWIAMFALLASVLAPVAVRAMAVWTGSSSPWDEICTAFGIKKASSPVSATTQTPDDSGGTRAQGDCPFCLPSGNPAALPAQPSGVPPAVERDNARYLFFFISVAPPRVLPDNAQPRAPPLSA